MRGIFGCEPGWGLTVVRIMAAIVFIVSGYGKWVGGIGATAAGFAKIGIPLPGVAAPFIATLELAGGTLLALGLLTRPLALLFAVEMTVTSFYVKFPAQWWNPVRIDLMLLAAGVLLILAGPGRVALDNMWRMEKQ